MFAWIHFARIEAHAAQSLGSRKTVRLFDAPKPNPCVVLDGSVFDKALRTHKDEKGCMPFTVLPAKFAEQIGIGIRNDFSNWRKSLQAYSQTPAAFKTMPGLSAALALAARPQSLYDKA